MGATRRKSEDDVALVRAALARDAHAWRKLVDRHHGTLRAVIAQAAEGIHPITEDQVDDLLGDFWLLLLEDHLRRLRAFLQSDDADLGGWLALLATQVACNHARKLARGPRFVSLDQLKRGDRHTMARDVATEVVRMLDERASLDATGISLRRRKESDEWRDERQERIESSDPISMDESGESLSSILKAKEIATIFRRRRKRER
jgi:hypothetical protein